MKVNDLSSESAERVYAMTDQAPTMGSILGLPTPARAEGAPISEIVADLAGVTRLAILVPDGLGRYAWRLWHTEMPYLSSLHDSSSATSALSCPP